MARAMHHYFAMNNREKESGRVGYVLMYFMGVPIGVLLVLWLLLGNNIFSPG